MPCNGVGMVLLTMAWFSSSLDKIYCAGNESKSLFKEINVAALTPDRS